MQQSGQSGLSQPACLYFMLQLQHVIGHAHKMPFYHDIFLQERGCLRADGPVESPRRISRYFSPISPDKP